jgi:hypothetical protein
MEYSRTLLVLFMISSAFPATAFPPPLCMVAVSSQNGKYLVITDRREDQNEKGLSVTLKVLYSLGVTVNENDRLNAPATYWTDALKWSVIFDKSQPVSSCPLSLITDDGEFLVVNYGYWENAGLRIFRRPDGSSNSDRGIVVKDVTIKELWPADKVVAQTEAEYNKILWMSPGPAWFAGGTFKFSADNRYLIHKTRWGNTVRIDLRNGAVKKE